MSTRLEFPEVFELPIEKKVALAQELCDDIADSTLPATIPPGILAELNRRREEILANPSIGLTLDQVKQRLMAKYAAPCDSTRG